MGLILTWSLLKGWFKKLGNPTNRNWLAQDQLLPFLSALNSESQDGAAEISMICLGMGTWGDNTLIEMFIHVPLLLSCPTGSFSLHVPMNLWQSAGFSDMLLEIVATWPNPPPSSRSSRIHQTGDC